MLFLSIDKVNIANFCKLIPYTQSMLLANFIYPEEGAGKSFLGRAVIGLVHTGRIYHLFPNKVFRRKKIINTHSWCLTVSYTEKFISYHSTNSATDIHNELIINNI